MDLKRERYGAAGNERNRKVQLYARWEGAGLIDRNRQERSTFGYNA